jgi:hypothetical protein
VKGPRDIISIYNTFPTFVGKLRNPESTCKIYSTEKKSETTRYLSQHWS